MSNPPPIPSDITEPHLARVIGILWQRFERSGQEPSDYRTLWDGVRTLNLFTTVASGEGIGCHASIMCNNALGKLAAYIKREINIDPYKEWRMA